MTDRHSFWSEQFLLLTHAGERLSLRVPYGGMPPSVAIAAREAAERHLGVSLSEHLPGQNTTHYIETRGQRG